MTVIAVLVGSVGLRINGSHWNFMMQRILGLISAWGMLFVDMRSFGSMRYAQVMRHSFGAILIWVSHQHLTLHSSFFFCRSQVVAD